jgi:uncharacterized membrane protein YhaH (DUF805 family)
MEWMFLPLKRYFDFSGRSRRKEFWIFFLFQFLVQIALLSLGIMFAVNETFEAVATEESWGSIAPFILLFGIWAVFWLVMLIPNVALVVRRFHDQGISGVVGVLLYIGTVIFTLPGVVILIFMCMEGKTGDNQYGKDPKLNENIGDIFR